MTTPTTQRTVEDLSQAILDRVSVHDEMHPNDMTFEEGDKSSVPCGCLDYIKKALTAERSISDGLRDKLSLAIEGLEKIASRDYEHEYQGEQLKECGAEWIAKELLTKLNQTEGKEGV
jgi:hypothetical protein